MRKGQIQLSLLHKPNWQFKGSMAKVKILKKLPKSKTKISKQKGKVIPHDKATTNSFADNYLRFYDDIKINSRRNDW